MEKKSVYETLSAINCNGHTEKKNGLTYLAWAFAWAEVKKAFPSATYTIYENANGCFYHTDGKTAWVKTGVTIDGIELIEYLPVMDFRNQSIPIDKITSFDVNKTIQRSLTKACARHGLGLYIYAGEDLPTDMADDNRAKDGAAQDGKPKTVAPAANAPVNPAKPSAAELAKPAPKVVKKAQVRKPSPRAAAAWKAFKAVESIKAMTDADRETAWKNLIFTATGKTGAGQVEADSDWDKVDNEISVLAAM